MLLSHAQPLADAVIDQDLQRSALRLKLQIRAQHTARIVAKKKRSIRSAVSGRDETSQLECVQGRETERQTDSGRENEQFSDNLRPSVECSANRSVKRYVSGSSIVQGCRGHACAFSRDGLW